MRASATGRNGPDVTDVIIIGGGINGLVAAAMLAKAGRKPLVLERADRVGGCATTSEMAPGFRCPTLTHRAHLDPALVRTLQLERHGLQILRSDALVSAPAADHRMLTLWADEAQACRSIAAFSPADAERYPGFMASLRRMGTVVRALLSAPAPSIDNPGAADLFELLKTGRRFRALGKTDAYRLLRWLPMAAADLVGEWFSSEPLAAAISAGGVLGSHLGPREAGSGAILLLLASRDDHPIGGGWTARGGMGALADAVAAAARAAGAAIRTGVDVQAISVGDDAVTGVVLAGGEEIRAELVASSLDPRRALGLVDPIHLAPDFLHAVKNIRMRGTLAKVNFAVSALPKFPGLDGARAASAALSGCVRLAADTNSIERAYDAAKYGAISDEPWIELTIPSIADPDLAPAGQHIVSAYVQYAPYTLRGTTWDAERERLGDIAARTIAKYAPGFTTTVLARQVITPLDLEQRYGLTGGHIFQGELALDQLLLARPLIGHARYATPIRGLFLCGSGTHPGTGLDGRSGALAAKEILKSS